MIKYYTSVYPFLIALVILAATVENLWPSIVGFIKTSPGMVFLGTVHHPADYFYYLSQYSQHHMFFSVHNLYTAEPLSPTFVGWLNVMLGTLFSFIGVKQIAAYQFSLVGLTVGVLLGAYALVKSILKTPRATLLGFFFFTLFHAFPVLREGVSSYADYWNNYAVPRVRMGGVPHHLAIALTSCILPLVFFRLTQDNKASKRVISVGILASCTLGSLQPALWLLIMGSIGITGAIGHVFSRKPFPPRVGLPILLIGSVGMLSVITLAQVFRNAPYTQLAAWEASQYTRFTVEHFLFATGPVFIIALVTLPLIVKQRAIPLLFTLVFTSISYTLFLSSLGVMVGISHVRFMSTLSVLGTAIIAAFGIDRLLATKSTWLRFVAYTVIVGITTLLLPNHAKTLLLSTQFASNNLYQYLPQKDYALMTGLATQSADHDTFLLPAPYNTIFPAVSGRRSYNGHPLITIEATRKDREVARFFAPEATGADMHSFVIANGISWIVTVPNPTLASADWVQEISRSDNLVAYKVQK